jgi:hypothetical protein
MPDLFRLFLGSTASNVLMMQIAQRTKYPFHKECIQDFIMRYDNELMFCSWQSYLNDESQIGRIVVAFYLLEARCIFL